MRLRRQCCVAGAMMVLLAASIVGCDDDPSSPRGGDSGESTATGESRAGPSVPPAASEDGPEGAEAYVKYYVGLVNYAADSGDTSTLSEVASDCGFCQQFPAVYDDIYDNGGSYEGKPYELSGVEVEERDDDVLATATLEALPTPFTLKEGDKTKKAEPETYVWKIELQPADDGWRITGVDETS